MKRVLIVLVGVILLGLTVLVCVLALKGGMPVLFPQGAIGIAERNLMLEAMFLMLIVVLPVYLLIIIIGRRYRAGNTKAKYTPDWEHSRLEELVWWAIPFEIVLVLGALTWGATHQLATSAPIASAEAPLTVQVVALPWKWLFIYPEQGVASVNELALPEGRPVEFQITADAPMNSFWIPALGGQMYAMSGMVTMLHLEADSPGTFEGRSANYSGEGFADMTFPVNVMDEDGFDAWVQNAASSSDALTPAAYAALARPSSSMPARYYGTMTLGFMDIVHMTMEHH